MNIVHPYVSMIFPTCTRYETLNSHLIWICDGGWRCQRDYVGCIYRKGEGFCFNSKQGVIHDYGILSSWGSGEWWWNTQKIILLQILEGGGVQHFKLLNLSFNFEGKLIIIIHIWFNSCMPSAKFENIRMNWLLFFKERVFWILFAFPQSYVALIKINIFFLSKTKKHVRTRYYFLIFKYTIGIWLWTCHLMFIII